MTHPIIQELEAEQIAGKQIDEFTIGDTVDVYVRIVEGEKERVQVFSGTVIARKSGGVNACFTVRRLVAGEGVERVFPLYSPRVEKVVAKRRGKVCRAKLYYLRDRIGKATRLKEETREKRKLVIKEENLPKKKGKKKSKK